MRSIFLNLIAIFFLNTIIFSSNPDNNTALQQPTTKRILSSKKIDALKRIRLRMDILEDLLNKILQHQGYPDWSASVKLTTPTKKRRNKNIRPQMPCEIDQQSSQHKLKTTKHVSFADLDDTSDNSHTHSKK